MNGQARGSGPPIARLEIGQLNVCPLAQALTGVDWSHHKTAFDVSRWSGWCINGCGQATRGEVLLGYYYDPTHEGSQWFPEADPLVRVIPGPIHAVRLFRVSPNTRIRMHVDSGEYYLHRHWSELRKVHIPVIVNDRCYHSYLDANGSENCLQMKTGDAWYLNGNDFHGAANFGATDRWHLVIDVEPTERLYGMCSKGS